MKKQLELDLTDSLKALDEEVVYLGPIYVLLPEEFEPLNTKDE